MMGGPQGGRGDLHNDWGERKRRALVIRAWVERYGYFCPGYGIPRHESRDLTADHLVAVAVGGAHDGPLGVLCRSCNGRKAHNIEPIASTPETTSRDWFS